MLLAGEDEQGGEVVGLDEGEVAGVVLDDVVGAGAVGGTLAGEPDLEGTRGSVLSAHRGSGSEDVEGAGTGLAGVVYADGAVVLDTC